MLQYSVKKQNKVSVSGKAHGFKNRFNRYSAPPGTLIQNTQRIPDAAFRQSSNLLRRFMIQNQVFTTCDYL
jgi:hypothetical protein